MRRSTARMRGAPRGATSRESCGDGSAHAVPATSNPAARTPRAKASALGTTQPFTSQLRFTGQREALHQVLQGLLGVRGLAELVLTQRELVQRRRDAVLVGILGRHLRVLDGGAVESRLREEA